MEQNSPSLSVATRTRGGGRGLRKSPPRKAKNNRDINKTTQQSKKGSNNNRKKQKTNRKLDIVAEDEEEVDDGNENEEQEEVEEEESDDDNASSVDTNSTDSTELKEQLRDAADILKKNKERLELKRQRKSPPSEVTLSNNNNNINNINKLNDDDKSNAMDTYIQECKVMGNMDTEDDKEEYYKILTRKHVWKHFKVVTEDDFDYGTNLSRYFCNKAERVFDKAETRRWWDGIKAMVQRCMMDMRSACTQSMKRKFLGKYFDNIFTLRKIITN